MKIGLKYPGEDGKNGQGVMHLSMQYTYYCLRTYPSPSGVGDKKTQQMDMLPPRQPPTPSDI